MSQAKNTRAALMIYVTCPSPAVARVIAAELVEHHEAACVNILPGVESVYRWQGRIEVDPETLLLIKSRAERLDEVKKRIASEHPDEVPEIVAVPIVAGSTAYLDWLEAQTRA